MSAILIVDGNEKNMKLARDVTDTVSIARA